MSGDPTRRTRGGPPLGLLGALLAVAVVEWSLGRFARHAETVADDWRRSAQVAASADVTGCEVLCFGDSQMKLGVQPHVIEARTGRRAYNLALVAGQAPASYFLLRRALDAGARPQAVIVNFIPGLLGLPPEFNIDHWPDLLTARESWELTVAARDPDLGTGLVLRRVFRSLKARDEIRSWGHRQMLRQRVGPFDTALAQRRLAMLNRGAIPRPKPPGFIPYVTTPREPLPLDRWHCLRVNEIYLRKFLGTLAERKVPVFWVAFPFRSDMQAYLDKYDLYERFDPALRTLVRQFPNLTIIDARRTRGVDEFFDPTHLETRGALALSGDVAEVIGRALDVGPPPGRWVALREVRPDPSEPMPSRVAGRPSLESRR